MKDFNYYAPTEVVFGEQSEEQVAALVKKYGGTKVSRDYTATCGALKVLKADDMEAIYKMARG